ncbi:MAG: hypothetical protein QCI00_04565 [Candidatus Thermoplasmatota archaeon]|nr:hypothetical protein [Candidatus Thermoplasmatota archaeon]
MKVFYHSGEGKFTCVDKSPLISYQTLESGTVVMWHDRTMNSLINKSI